MARPSKIEQHGLEDKILKLRNNDKTFNEIVDIVKEENNVKLSVMAVKRWVDKHEDKIDEKAVEVIREDKRRVAKSLNYTYDVIQSQLNISCRVLNKLELIQDTDHLIDKITESAKVLMDHGMEISSFDFTNQIAEQISDNILDFTRLTREVRENNKFLADLQSKIYDFSLLQEFVLLFIDKFKKEDIETTLKVLKEIKKDPRMKMLIESSERDEQS
ncbi:hypothetical protein [Tissierella sp.]|uniref:hypothetical protein n=1 Tax=Tissierella sp. TaxID=41274 RepID=UPI00306C607C